MKVFLFCFFLYFTFPNVLLRSARRGGHATSLTADKLALRKDKVSKDNPPTLFFMAQLLKSAKKWVCLKPLISVSLKDTFNSLLLLHLLKVSLMMPIGGTAIYLFIFFTAFQTTPRKVFTVILKNSSELPHNQIHVHDRAF